MKERKINRQARLNFSSYAVNSRGEVIPVISKTFGKVSEGESKTYDQIALRKLSEIRSIKLL